jgi:hypothetical protein
MSVSRRGEAVKKLKLLEVRKGKPFGQKLMGLAKERNMHSAADIAAALYENDLCFELVHPRDRVRFAPPSGHRCVCQRTLGGDNGQHFNQSLCVQS